MGSKLSSKPGWPTFALVVGFFALIVHVNGRIFFINRTASMPKGIYLKIKSKYPSIGDIIIFQINSYKGNLIKYVSAIAGGEYCFDEQGSLWVEGNFIAQKNTEKYPDTFQVQSLCSTLESDELLVIGEHENSYDSRYFGPIRRSEVIATVKLFR